MSHRVPQLRSNWSPGKRRMAFFFISDVETLAELHQKKTRHGVLRETEDSDAAVLDAVVDQNSGSVSLRNDLHSNPLH